MSGSAGKMGGAEMKEGLKSSLLNKVKVTDKFWRGYQELVMDTVIPYQEKILNDEIPGVERAMHWQTSVLQRDWKRVNFTEWFSRTVMLPNGWKV